MGSIGLVIVSHSKHIAQGVVELISEVAKDVPITYVGGTEDGGIGTSFDQVDRVVSENPADTLLAFFDLGSAKMNLEMVADFSDKSIRINRGSNCRRCLYCSCSSSGWCRTVSYSNTIVGA